ncbi:SOS response-associated peptidase [Mesorhizobium onobrychidis]|uniref:SOS response-associated peptidase n=1 Tax=Mesorhizobium onobrychidis TaxID=2775404 RepID=UPI0021574677|nr:SOS response-associated peptidase [Mesorhizobium onobrychidis]
MPTRVRSLTSPNRFEGGSLVSDSSVRCRKSARRIFVPVWAYNKNLDITSCTIITAAAGDPMRQIHDRQPVILDPGLRCLA